MHIALLSPPKAIESDHSKSVDPSERVCVAARSPAVSWRVRMIRSPFFAVIGVFMVVVVVAVYLGSSHEAAQIVASMAILAGIVISFIDRHNRDSVMSKELRENTVLTQQVPAKIAQEAEKVAVKLADSTAKTIDEKIEARGAEVAEIIADKTSDTYQKAFKQGYEAGQLAMRRELSNKPAK